MTNTAQALYQFFSSFGLPAYGKNNVPQYAAMPYITYELVHPAGLEPALFHAWVFYRGDSYGPIASKVDEIEQALAEGGAAIPTESGCVHIMTDRNTPFAQEQADPDKNVRVMFLTMILHANTD